MLKTTITGKGRVGLLLCLTGLLSFATATTIRADGEPSGDGNTPSTLRADYDTRPADNATLGSGNNTAPSDEAAPNDQDPPSRVARLSYLDGSVSMQPGGSGDWAAAVKNRPVTIGDKIWVDKDGRAELQAGQISIHLGAMTALSFLNLDQNITQMRLAEGSINFRVRELREGDTYEVDTPNAAFIVREAGAFRIDVNENGDGTLVTAIRGSGEVTSGGKSYDIRPGQLAEFNGTDNNIEYHSDRAPEPDDFDQWSLQRDKREENSVSARYMSRDTDGYSDLDENGTWSEVPNQGNVWYPNSVPPGWAPYSDGYWSYVGPWGWTWIDYAPWGFAPYHYGRWGFIGGRWGWAPGPIGVYPIYGPAFVGFLGGGGFGFGIGLGVGWFPLGFGEVYHPWYRYNAGGAYIRNINIHNTFVRNVNTINSVHNTYAYAHNAAAVTTTSHNAFVGGQAVNRSASHVTEASLRSAEVTNHVTATPTRTSYTGAAAASARVSRPSTAVQNRSVIARTPPAAAASRQAVRTVGSGSNTNRSAAYASNRGAGANPATATRARSDRPSWAGSGSTANTRTNTNRPPSANTSRAYEGSSSRSYSAPSAPSRSYSPAPSRTYSAPSHSAPAPSHSAPSPSHSSGGGSSHGGGGGSSHSSGGGGSHGGHR
jgi:uncharacterized membrane protein YgcG